jgi:hypothetical protein
MRGLVPRIHAFFVKESEEHVDGRDKRGHDDIEELTCFSAASVSAW